MRFIKMNAFHPHDVLLILKLHILIDKKSQVHMEQPITYFVCAYRSKCVYNNRSR